MKRVERLKHENDYIIECTITYQTYIKPTLKLCFFRLCDMYYFLHDLSKINNVEFTYTYEYVNNERKIKMKKFSITNFNEYELYNLLKRLDLRIKDNLNKIKKLKEIEKKDKEYTYEYLEFIYTNDTTNISNITIIDSKMFEEISRLQDQIEEDEQLVLLLDELVHLQ